MKFWFCEGSRTSSRADAGSPRALVPTLSISSSKITGLLVPQRFKAYLEITEIKTPGNAPIYVLLCPLISASSLTPPNEIL